MRYFFHIGYSGFNYQGWQRNPQSKGVQEVIETLLSQVLKSKLTILGCGRTDSKVHAAQFFFHVDIDEKWDYDLIFRLNKNLPPDISVFDIIPVEHNQHARFDAISRTYNYFIHTNKDPFLARMSSLYPPMRLNFDDMKKAVRLLKKYNDYKPFCKGISTRTTICKVSAADLYTSEDSDGIRFEITSNRFLNGMIRIIVQKLLQIGQGQMSTDEFENHFITRENPADIKGAYPQGLYLSQVKYPFLEMPAKSELFKLMANEERWIMV